MILPLIVSAALVGVTLAANGCPSQFTRNGDDCYRDHGEKTWNACENICQPHGHIATPKTAAQNAYVFGIGTQSSRWIGLSDRGAEGTFRWEDADNDEDKSLLSAYPWSNWNGNEPNNGGGNEDCAHIRNAADATWNDLPCAGSQPIKLKCICQRPAVGCPAGYHVRGTKCYKNTGSKTHRDCKKACGAFLPALPKSAAETSALKSLESFWVWADDKDPEGTFKSTATGDILSYTHWGTGQPQSFAAFNEDCVMATANNMWHDYPCGGSDTAKCVCEARRGVDHCSGDPCQNSGSCTSDSSTTGYTCTCATGWTGPTCTDSVNDCASHTCLHGACVDGHNTYTCSCSPGWEGGNCDTSINDCAPNPCANGGLCTDGHLSHTCECLTGFMGDSCQTKCDWHLKSARKNKKFTACKTLEHYDDKTLEECQGLSFLYPDANGIAHRPLSDDYKPGHCNVKKCIGSDFKLTPFTAAQYGNDIYQYFGTRCPSVCYPTPCQNGAACVNHGTTFVCDCTEGWTGATCGEAIPVDRPENPDDAFSVDVGPDLPADFAQPLGMQSGIIQYGQISASSSQVNHPAQHARPNSGGGWKPRTNDANPGLQITFPKLTYVHGVGTLGHYGDGSYMKSYKINVYNKVEDSWSYLKERINGQLTSQIKIFTANSDRNTWKRHCLHRYYGNPIAADAIKLDAVTWSGANWGARVELYGKMDPQNPLYKAALENDHWTQSTTGCGCYDDATGAAGKVCACCRAGGHQCSSRFPNQCVQGGYEQRCGAPELSSDLSSGPDMWTLKKTGCKCPESNSMNCACCVTFEKHALKGCPCGARQPNQCVRCGTERRDCGAKEDIFGKPAYCNAVCPKGKDYPNDGVGLS